MILYILFCLKFKPCKGVCFEIKRKFLLEKNHIALPPFSQKILLSPLPSPFLPQKKQKEFLPFPIFHLKNNFHTSLSFNFSP